MQHVYRLLGLIAALVILPSTAWAQFTVEGTVRDADTNETLVGVNVIVAGTSAGAATDVDGQFSLEVPGDAGTLQFSYIGYSPTEVEVTPDSSPLDVSMSPDIANLEELVVTGLATSVKRENLANSVTKIDADAIAGTVVPTTVDNALQGKLAGVNIVSQGGAPGGGVNVQLRGISTLGAGSSQPLYIIDGVYVNNAQIGTGRSIAAGAAGSTFNPFSSGNVTTNGSQLAQDDAGNRLADLNPEDIESIEVLKGASAAAIYGQRANAGVVIITTKRGANGRTRVSLSQDIGFASALNLQGVASWDEAKVRSFYEGTTRLDAELERFRQAQESGQFFNYEEEFYGETGLLSNTQLSVSGGNERTQFYVGGGLKSEDGIIENTGFDRRSIRANIDHRITPRIQVASRTNYVYSDSDRGFTGNQNNTGASIGYNIANIPTYADLTPREDGTYPVNPYFSENPYRLTDLAVNNQEVSRVFQALSTEFDLIQSAQTSLTFRVNGGIDYLNASSTVFFGPEFQFQQTQANPGDVVQGQSEAFNTNFETFLVFDQNVDSDAGEFNFTSQVGFARFTQDNNTQFVRGQGLVSGQTNPLNGSIQQIFNFDLETVRDIGFVGQQEVNWADRLIGTLGARLDRSTLNASQDDYYFYPKASLAANLHNFDFWTFDDVNQFKLRAAYGETGGLPQFGVTSELLTPAIIGGGLGTVISTRGVDPSLEPERARELEVGIDLSVLNNIVSLEATYYRKEISDLILDRQNASSTGITTIAQNAGDLRNTGVELALAVSPIRTQEFSWTSRTLFWTNDSEITDLTIPAFTTGGFGAALGTYLIQEGFSPTTIVGTPATDPEEIEGGGPLFTVYGDAQPDFQMSFLNEFTLFRNLEASVLFHWSQGGENINLSRFLTDFGGTTDDWNQDSDGDGVPNGIQRRSGNASRFVEDASYVKLREAALYYNVPPSFLERLSAGTLSSARIGVSGTNLLLFSDYDSYDPEVSVFGTQPIAQSVEVTPFPSARQIFFHLRVQY